MPPGWPTGHFTGGPGGGDNFSKLDFSSREICVTAENRDRIWFNPPKFWAATKSMSQEDADQLMARIVVMAERRQLDALRKYDFVSVGSPYQKNKLAS